jgi:hypothetical protein
MWNILISLFSGFLAGFRSRLALQTEILALRHQIIFLKRSAGRPKLLPWDRFLWIGILRFWPHWRSALVIIKPETVIARNRKGFRLFWIWKCPHGKSGRPGIPKDVHDLIIHNPGSRSHLWRHGEVVQRQLEGLEIQQVLTPQFRSGDQSSGQVFQSLDKARVGILEGFNGRGDAGL